MASNAPSLFEAAKESLTLLEDQFEQVELLSVLPNQAYDSTGEIVDVVDIGFRIRGRPGMFFVHPLFLRNWQALAFVQIGLKHATVEGIYQGLASKADLPAGPIGAPLVPIGKAVAV